MWLRTGFNPAEMNKPILPVIDSVALIELTPGITNNIFSIPKHYTNPHWVIMFFTIRIAREVGDIRLFFF